MCGIAGCIDWQEDLTTRLPILEAMGETLSCRGPDAAGVWASICAAFAHRRLIVIDPEGGGQPMLRSVGNRTYIITYNGELYNMDEIRKDLDLRGHSFQSRSDTELILRAYIEWGPDCVERLNGIFAFGIWDESEKSLFLARDRLGVKPLFYAKRDHVFAFGSELKAILAHPSFPAEVDLDGLSELFFIGPARTPGLAVFKGIQELRPGHWLLHTERETKVHQFWKLESHEHEENLETTAVHVRELLEDAITRQLVSDVPVVTLLSGGLDSSAVTAYASRAMNNAGRGPLHTYSVDFADMEQFFEANAYQTSRDAPWVKRVSSFLGTTHHDVIFDTPDLIEHLARPLAARDLPGMADIDVSLFLFCREIKKNATVALSGEAADEVFGGYPWFHRQDAINADTFPWSRQLHERIGICNPDFVSEANPEAYVARRYEEALAEVPYLPSETGSTRRIREISYLSITRFLPTLLERKDRTSMATGLEVRVPFCDHRLVEYVWNIPWDLKNFGGTPKAILRKAVEGVLPDDVIYRKKSPYPSTHHPAYMEAVRGWLLEILENPASRILNLIDKQAVLNLIESSKTKSEHRPWFGQIMGIAQMFDYLIQVETWLSQYHVRIV